MFSPQSPCSNHWMAGCLQKSQVDLCAFGHALHHTISQSETGAENLQVSCPPLWHITFPNTEHRINSDHLTAGLRIKPMISESPRWKIQTYIQGNLAISLNDWSMLNVLIHGFRRGQNLIFPIGKTWVMGNEKLRYFIAFSFTYQYVTH